MVIQNNCPGCGREVQRATNSAGNPVTTIIHHEDHQGLWHYDCYVQASKDGRTKAPTKHTCARCGNQVQYSHDEFLYRTLPDGRRLWMHGTCHSHQLRADIGLPTPGESQVRKHLKTVITPLVDGE